MASQSSYAHTGLHQHSARQAAQHVNCDIPLSDRHASHFYLLQASTSSSDSGQYIGAREMGPPPSFSSHYPSPPQPVEIEMHSSRILPNPTATWDAYSPPVFGQFADLGHPVTGRPVEIPRRINAPDPLQQWYTGNDGPWIPKNISAVREELPHSKPQPSPRMSITYESQHKRQNASEAGSYPFPVAPSDSGYGTRHSEGNASIFSGDINDRDQDSQVGQVGRLNDHHQFQELNTDQHHDNHAPDSWGLITGSSPFDTSLICQSCQRPAKTRSELKKHKLRHTKPFVCRHPGCSRTDGFSTTNDLERHTKSKHPFAPSSAATRRYRCRVEGCKSKDKLWPRLDNFRSHLKRVHSEVLRTEEDLEHMMRQVSYVDHIGRSASQEASIAQRMAVAGPSQAMDLATQDPSPNTQSVWTGEAICPNTIENAQGPLSAKRPSLEKHAESSTPDLIDPTLDSLSQATVLPEQVFPPPQSKLSSLESVAPLVGGDLDLGKMSTVNAGPQAVIRTSKVSPHGKTTRLNEVSASEATEAVIAALAELKVPEKSNSRRLIQHLDQTNLPEQLSGGALYPAPSSIPAQSSTEDQSGHKKGFNSLAVQEESKSVHEDQARVREVLETLHALGYTLHKDSSHPLPQKAQNLGSAASNKSEKIVVCPTCKRFQGRPCELTKHMKRHSRPYGCTFPTCNKTFGSKNDWKRHENSQHFHLETWRCNVEKVEGHTCSKVCYRRQSFQDHLKKDHEISDEGLLKEKVDRCRIGRNCQARFWCGFCAKLIGLTKKGVDALTERFDHIDDHFMGRGNVERKGIQDWIPVDSDMPRGNMESQSPPEKDVQSSSGDSSPTHLLDGRSPGASVDAARIPANVPSVDGNLPRGSKRSRSSSDDDGEPAKHQKTATRLEAVVICCQCEGSHNPKLESRCTYCPDTHSFCDNCTRGTRVTRESDQDKSPS